MSKNRVEHTLPGWRLVVSLFNFLLALVILYACRDFGLSLWIGVPAALAVIVAGTLVERFIERKYSPSHQGN